MKTARLAILCVALLAVALSARDAAGASAALQAEQAEPNWFFSASAYTCIVPDSREYVQPTITMDRRRLHIEAGRFYRLGKPPS